MGKMKSKKTEQIKTVTSKLPKNLKPYFEEMDLIDRFGIKLVENSHGKQRLDLVSQLMGQKYDEGVDYFLFTINDQGEKPICEVARVSGQLKKDLNFQIPESLERNYSQVLQQKVPLLLQPNLPKDIAAVLLVPIVAGQQVIGLILLISAQGDRLTKQDAFFLSGLAQIVSPAIFNSANQYKLNEVYDLMVEAWGRAVDDYEGALEGHCVRVAELTRRLAIRIGVRGERLTTIWRGAMLHDLGKLGISDSILFKEAALDMKEWEEMRHHPTFAYDIIRRVPFLKDSQEIPYSHHEKWDGTGYPRGLRGEEIPLEARIYALVDVWDALLSERPYRSAWKKETAVEFLRNNLGSHFDPVLGAEFLKLIDEEGLG